LIFCNTLFYTLLTLLSSSVYTLCHIQVFFLYLAHKRKKREYYLKKKDVVKKEYNYEIELDNENFSSKIKEIIKAQKSYLDSRKDIIISKLNDYKNKKKEYYELNKEKRLEYDKEYRQKKKEELKEYRKEYYKKSKENKL
jgi:hypothetical protein